MKPMKVDHHSATDEQLCAWVAAGDRSAEETLVLRYARLVRVCSRPFFLAGGDSEDLIQEGMLGLLAAIREFRPDRGARFSTYAQVCVRRRIISAVRLAAGGKHAPLNDYVSLEPSLLLADSMESLSNPEDVVIHQEALHALETAIVSRLTPLEAQVLAHFLEGSSYTEIAEAVGIALGETKYFRFPGGSVSYLTEERSAEMKEMLAERGYLVFDWNVVTNDALLSLREGEPPLDYIRRNFEETLERCLAETGGREGVPIIVLMHETVPETIELLPWMVETLARRGFSFGSLENFARSWTFADRQ